MLSLMMSQLDGKVNQSCVGSVFFGIVYKMDTSLNANPILEKYLVKETINLDGTETT